MEPRQDLIFFSFFSFLVFVGVEREKEVRGGSGRREEVRGMVGREEGRGLVLHFPRVGSGDR